MLLNEIKRHLENIDSLRDLELTFDCTKCEGTGNVSMGMTFDSEGSEIGEVGTGCDLCRGTGRLNIRNLEILPKKDNAEVNKPSYISKDLYRDYIIIKHFIYEGKEYPVDRHVGRLLRSSQSKKTSYRACTNTVSYKKENGDLGLVGEYYLSVDIRTGETTFTFLRGEDKKTISVTAVLHIVGAEGREEVPDNELVLESKVANLCINSLYKDTLVIKHIVWGNFKYEVPKNRQRLCNINDKDRPGLRYTTGSIYTDSAEGPPLYLGYFSISLDIMTGEGVFEVFKGRLKTPQRAEAFLHAETNGPHPPIENNQLSITTDV